MDQASFRKVVIYLCFCAACDSRVCACAALLETRRSTSTTVFGVWTCKDIKKRLEHDLPSHLHCSPQSSTTCFQTNCTLIPLPRTQLLSLAFVPLFSTLIFLISCLWENVERLYNLLSWTLDVYCWHLANAIWDLKKALGKIIDLRKRWTT